VNLLSLLYRISAWQLAAAVLASVLSGIAELGTTICVLESFRRGAILWWQFAIVAALALITGRYSRYVVNKLASKSSARMRRRLVRAVLQLPLRSLEDLGPTRLLIAFTGELSSVATAVRNLASLSTNGAILLACLAYIGWLSLREMFIVAALCLICIVGAFLLRALEKRHRHAARESWDRVLNLYGMALEGIKQLKLNPSLARRVLFAFDEGLREQQQSTAARGRYSDLVATWTQGMSYIILGAVVFDPYGAGASLKLGFGLLIVLQLRRPLRSLITDSSALFDALVAFERLSDVGLALTERPPDQDEPRLPPAVTRGRLHLKLNAVCFEYGGANSDKDFRLGPLDFVLRRGETVFVAGGNGSGKTTFAKLITGLYAPTDGTIQFNAVTIDDSCLRWYRKKFAAVFADYCLFEGSADLRPDELGDNAEWLLSRLVLNRETLVVPVSAGRSTQLSSGERGRIALLRAVIEDRPIMVFDEWAADQDPAYKEFFYMEFLPRMRSARKLLIVISEDERYFHTADRLLWLERGEPPVWRSPSSFTNDVGMAPGV
jgi:putative pyoverdin transport system ATP-binding/permease protein